MGSDPGGPHGELPAGLRNTASGPNASPIVVTIEIFVVAVAGAAAVFSWLGTGAVRGYALQRSMVDLPSDRSSHTQPTPRGGGLAIAVVVLGMIGLIMIREPGMTRFALALFGSGMLVAGVGWIDDHGHVPASLRLTVHLLAAGWAVWWLDAPEQLILGPWTVRFGPAGSVIAVLGLVWLTNLFNFMDGIDGIAAVETITVAAVGALFLYLGEETELAIIALVIASAAGGFLVWNLPPAKIFMGDVGSGFIGIVIGVLVLAGAQEGAVSVLIWALLMGVFLFDATVTLLRRVGKQPLHQAHKEHAYQRAVQVGHTHGRVTLAVALLNAALSVLAFVAWCFPQAALFVFATAFIMLSTAYLWVERLKPMS